jgi:hypothetical protein
LCSQPFLRDTHTSATVSVVLMLALTALEPFLVAVRLFCVTANRALLAGVLRVNII